MWQGIGGRGGQCGGGEVGSSQQPTVGNDGWAVRLGLAFEIIQTPQCRRPTTKPVTQGAPCNPTNTSEVHSHLIWLANPRRSCPLTIPSCHKCCNDTLLGHRSGLQFT